MESIFVLQLSSVEPSHGEQMRILVKCLKQSEGVIWHILVETTHLSCSHKNESLLSTLRLQTMRVTDATGQHRTCATPTTQTEAFYTSDKTHKNNQSLLEKIRQVST